MSGFSLRDQLFNATTVGGLADRLAAGSDVFDRGSYVAAVLAPFPELQLKARIHHMAQELRAHLPSDYEEALTVVVAALPPMLDPTRSDDDFGDFILAPLSRFVALYGCSYAHLDSSLAALREITMRFSAEDAIRAFINAFPNETYAVLDRWSEDDHYHVRRLVSEGTRPRLPWSARLSVGLSWPLALLDRLYADPTRYVTRSVANHLNDISKSDPALAVRTVQAWRDAGRQRPEEMAYIARHGLRGLVKAGDRAALGVLGFGDAPSLARVDVACLTPEVRLGTSLEFEVVLETDRAQALLVDYRMHFARPDGRPSSKVFKLGRRDSTAGEAVTLGKRHPLRPMTTRRLYPGEHRIEIQVNGAVVASFTFALVEAS